MMLNQLGKGYTIRTIRVRDRESNMFHKLLTELNNLTGNILCYTYGKTRVYYLNKEGVRVVYTVHTNNKGEKTELMRHSISKKVLDTSSKGIMLA